LFSTSKKVIKKKSNKNFFIAFLIIQKSKTLIFKESKNILKAKQKCSKLLGAVKKQRLCSKKCNIDIPSLPQGHGFLNIMS